MLRNFLSVAAAFCALSTSVLGATVIYSNTTTDTFDTLAYTANGFTQIGDQVHLAGTDRFATLATVQFFNLGSAGTFDAILRLYSVGAPVGLQIGADFTLTGISAVANGVFNVSFVLPNLPVPDNLIFAVSISKLSSGVQLIGLNMFEPPTIGSSDNSFAIANNGTSFIQTGTPNENVFFELQASAASGVPEPTTISVSAAGLLALALLRRRY